MLTLNAAAVVSAVALLTPLALSLMQARIPEIVVEILAGIVIGPQVLGWSHNDAPVQVLAVIGLGFLLLLAGLEIDFTRIRGSVLVLTSAAFLLSFAVALVIGFVFNAIGLVRSPLLIAVILSATSLGIILPVLKDAGQLDTRFGQLVVAGASLAEVLPIVALSLLFSDHATGVASQIALLVTFLGFVGGLGLVVLGIERSSRVTRALLVLQDTTAEIRVRGAVALLILLAAVATRFGLEAILGAFLAGATLKLVDRDEDMTHSLLPTKLQAVGFGVFIPFFFVSTGMALDVRSLFEDPTSLARVPLFLAGLLIARALPALLYRPLADRPSQLIAAGLLQATSLSIPVVAGAIGVKLGLVTPANNAALVAAGLLSVIAFPLLAVPRLGAERRQSKQVTRAGPDASAT